ncbi:MAG: lytic transglycosylase domain-containing protein [Candidatus Dadabacteria bacterium]|nr:lytic transglycosylase domain-containing protein [Candidatus Dadabacteria bacterium]NIS08735.1 lytic transglycosylase domain-containing protein [Candidatus Dadabacteria bacterium]NIV42619.1 transglycosylase SLT domain-containing protein [Candidatus Dadabacteria bacterium]NIX15421.1 transglycosylase SLT domain-containing protein [Candidatus Dadabacteria bacterium]NIY22084.1 transglycosylase SLT domain-containing protein [Candidatus Dadabacteria bacterium]
MKTTLLALLIILASNIAILSQELAYITEDSKPNYYNSSIDVEILSTLYNKTHPRVILKNNLSGEVKTYSIGDKFSYGNESYKVLHISDCLVTIIGGEQTVNLTCKEVERDYRLVKYSTLSQFRVINYDDIFTKSGDFKTDIDTVIKKSGIKYGVDPLLIKAVIKAESNFDPKAVSPKNAQGMMQLIPATAKDYGVADPFNASQNIEGGVKFLRDLIRFFKGDVDLVLAAYNAGPGTVMKYDNKVPPYPETQNYIKRVKKFYMNYRNRG